MFSENKSARIRMGGRILLSTALSTACCGAFAHPGDINTRFGFGGTVQVDLGGPTPRILPPASVAIDAKNRLIIGAQVNEAGKLAALNKDGALDFTFGTGGMVDVGGAVADLKVDSLGRIDVLQDMVIGDNWSTIISRYSNDGSLDTTFGVGGSVVLTAVDAGFYSYRLAVDDHDAVFVAGTHQGDSFNAYVAKITDIGTLDTSFATKGWTTLSFTTSSDVQTEGQAIAIDQTGAIIVGAYTRFSDGTIVDDVAKLKPNGALDTSFGHGAGFLQFDAAPGSTAVHYTFTNAIAIDADGNYVLAGGTGDWSSSDSVDVMRLTPAGDFDTSFNHGDPLIFNTRSDAKTQTNSVAITGDGKIVLGGFAQKKDTSLEGVVFSLNDDGTPDKRFGGRDGAVVLPMLNYGTSVAMTKNNKIAAMGFSGSLVVTELMP